MSDASELYEDLLGLQRWFKETFDDSPGAYERLRIVERLIASHAPQSEPSAMFQKAGPEAVALRKRHTDVAQARDALGVEFTDRPEIGNDPDLYELASGADKALAALSSAISAKLRRMCGVPE
jgi:hypothetical protein